ncbi:MAG: protein-export membrane protein SecF [Candidatus Levybacteria bacterium RBG_16_35_6]|nr:MAG: Protein translocase subunit SecF [Candidatus Levybacteria bacterium GW2011_GWA2_36_13]KKP99159.1 MAG: Protein translocase subunit SecF [Candidatus Levybacteria bacterium GW2011_GWB1_36_18]OGH10135.1 MAG: protein-export membrane protein SecF [Candidatus Levybacteria bacterium RBG_16_35_6]OGH43821.1 MAG: protein-export membrane protein SecF [Candidatus Levybacteria bacterium RIFCSPLOWO2_02_FULL_37_11]
MDVIGKKKIYFLISLLVLIPGTISLFLYGLNLSIDFTGGTRFTISFSQKVNSNDTSKVRAILNKEKIKVSSIEPSGKLMFVRTEPIPQEKNIKLREEIENSYKSSNIEQFETIGPTIGREITINALKAIVIASVLIVLYITYVFRKVPPPANSLSFGVSAIIALLHDVLVVIGIFSIFGHFLGVEIDSLFVTAVLTVIGFSVHDTIVVFDRIRENLSKDRGNSFSKIVNNSILQTLTRSIHTSLTVVLVLFTLLLFGGETIRWFVIALLIGVISGTYSSIFNASPILVVWHEWRLRRKSLSNKI